MGGCAKFLYTHNPFYLLSAGLVLFGLRTAFGDSQSVNAWRLAGFLDGYATLLALTAIVMVRLGKVWDDARTIALLVILLMLAGSSSFDTFCIQQPSEARLLLGIAFGFSVLLSEILIRGTGVRFPRSYRIPYYSLLALFFVFPPLIESSIWNAWEVSIPLRVLLFPIAAALISLLLIPAIYQERWHPAEHPWRWPWYPWSVFFFLAIGVIGRSYLLSLSFQSEVGFETTFGLYYLIPLFFAISILISEACAVRKSKSGMNACLLLPWIAIGMASVHSTSMPYGLFLQQLTSRVGSPLWVTLYASLLFCIYLWWRGATNAAWGTTPLLLLAVFIRPTDVFPDLHTPIYSWPLLIFGAYHGIRMWREWTAKRFVLAGFAGTFAISILTRNEIGGSIQSGLFLFHAIIIVSTLATIIFRDAVAHWLRQTIPAVLVVWICGSFVYGLVHPEVRLQATLYIAVLTIPFGMVWYANRMKLWKWTSLACGASFGLLILVQTLSASRIGLPVVARNTLALGGICFLLGGAISTIKSGAFGNCQNRLRQEWDGIVREWNARFGQVDSSNLEGLSIATRSLSE